MKYLQAGEHQEEERDGPDPVRGSRPNGLTVDEGAFGLDDTLRSRLRDIVHRILPYRSLPAFPVAIEGSYANRSPQVSLFRLLAKSDGRVDGGGDENGVEEEGGDGVDQHDPPHLRRRDRRVGCLRGHAQHVGEVDEIDAGRRGRVGEGETAMRAASACTVRLPENMGIVDRRHHVDGEPAERYGAEGEREPDRVLHALAVQRHEQRQHRHDHCDEGDEENDPDRHVAAGGVLLHRRR